MGATAEFELPYQPFLPCSVAYLLACRPSHPWRQELPLGFGQLDIIPYSSYFNTSFAGFLSVGIRRPFDFPCLVGA